MLKRTFIFFTANHSTVKNMTQTQTHDPRVLERLFGSTSATIRIIDFLSTVDCYDYNKTDIAKNSNISKQHITKALKKLEQTELIKKTRTVGRSEMYQYNMNNKAAELLNKFILEIAFQEGEKIATDELKNQHLQQPNTQSIEV